MSIRGFFASTMEVIWSFGVEGLDQKPMDTWHAKDLGTY